MTSMNGATLISWVSAKSPLVVELASRDRDRHRPYSAAAREHAADTGAVEIARQQARRRARGAVDELEIALRTRAKRL